MHALIRKIFPQRCLLCDLNHDGEKNICDYCEVTLPLLKKACVQCATEIISENAITHCSQCLLKPPPFHHTLALFYYEPPISSLIWRLKFRGDLSIAKLFSQYWIEYIENKIARDSLPEIIIPVSLHHQRLAQRGFNQALEIAKPLGKYFQIPVDTRSCIRIKNTEAQSLLPAKTRKNNMHNAFALSYPIDAKHVAILDDVMTTGNTVSEIAALLQKTGVEKIEVWCCARA